MRQRAVRTALLSLAVTAVLGATTAGTALAPAYAAGPATATTATAPGRERGSGHEATRAALRRLVEEGRLPGAAAVARDGRGTWFGSAGVADTGTGAKRTADDRFRAASITKVFIATVLLQLAAEGRLGMDDTVEKWLPGLVRGNGNDGRRVTLRQLLNHTSGIPNHTEDPAFQHNSSGKGFPEHRYDTHTPESLVALAMTYPPRSAPGEKPVYSNTNYVLAGLVIEKATGRTYAEEVTRRVIEPLGLRGTSFPGTGARMPAPHPVGYSRFHDDAPDAPVHDATEQNMTWLGAAGDLISTAGDLDRFHRALFRGDLLPPDRLAEMLDGVPGQGGMRYGLGVQSAELTCGVTVVGKDGRTNGSMSATVGTVDGRHQLTFNINGDWLQDTSLYFDVMEAEFCGKVPGRS
ncbi:beta-lactamase family protein [Streptomyces sp. HU2014]|uniref:Peptidase n=1 Tax=Streptomyces albireticuli TaxID=1940 RepID=A0A1Z2L0C9_9ACTN|nr:MULTISPECIES: serine hydrolase domain-containing protein [Streptomyces]ARZ67772.1 peptidase [Streptomyces albireticuli]UQI47774.1 beta-lactamase family protein [Streptomyces sp. HU2014]